MKTEKITDKGITLGFILRDSDWTPGLNFISEPEDFLQVGTWFYEKGKKLDPHTHLNVPRNVEYTQEVIYVKKGRLRADIFNKECDRVASVELHEGDTIVLLEGGHGYEILEKGTKILEIKNGPYVGAEKDRRRINK